ncbi:uncharacterized protein PHACADRAFT_212568 [Phanerochaete carnosa HHB-10118-sp]|uniref:Uncharacterized protein n=1 Tax=Phanerochaete carnosa (strain HHB-10118-sp) TaxID=650164 RepID=K5WNR1_PHACS|nr:uncharacterized protein PHACADRAFT_212568 [Phanerochaete carnosa HHB-10118-sp]EKM51957.1 hypothetical protein PHACADRAFT_212568 [Phanerochaete carnosa HHB-10118-sp]
MREIKKDPSREFEVWSCRRCELRHKAARTTVTADGDNDIQIIEPPADISRGNLDVSRGTSSARPSTASSQASDLAQLSLSSSHAPAVALPAVVGESIQLDDDDDIVALSGPVAWMPGTAQRSAPQDIRIAEKIPERVEIIDEQRMPTPSVPRAAGTTSSHLPHSIHAEKAPTQPSQAALSAGSATNTTFQKYRSPSSKSAAGPIISPASPQSTTAAPSGRMVTNEPGISSSPHSSSSNVNFDIRAQIAQMRADGRLNPPPSILNDILLPRTSAASSKTLVTPQSEPESGRATTEDTVHEVKLERRESTEDLTMQMRSASVKDWQFASSSLPLLLRRERAVGSGEAQDELDRALELQDRRVTNKQEGCRARERKVRSEKVKKLGPKARAKREQKEVQWVLPQ